MTHSLNNSQDIISLLTQDMIEREAFGLKKYGVYVVSNNGRNALQDAFEEVLDLCVYLKQRILEIENRKVTSVWQEVIKDMLNIALYQDHKKTETPLESVYYTSILSLFVLKTELIKENLNGS